MKTIIIFLSFTLFLFSQEIKNHYTNSLINHLSPYLKQHAYNPVNWYAWNKETLKKAKNENKLIFLSIGYSTCHWCHVMEKESFNNKALAKLFNKYYISIKVDREVQTYLDTHYQGILSSIKTRRNGWPLSAILTPNLEVLHITTYIPPYKKYGTEGLDTLLPRYGEMFKNDKKQIIELIRKNKQAIKANQTYKDIEVQSYTKLYIQKMSEVYDNSFKGFFKRPRFPLASNLNVLYDIYDLTGDKKAIKMVYEPLEAMAKGGIYDQIEGAFYRYSVHPDWIIPHFEKMLYTTAELTPLYIRAYKDTNNYLFKDIVTKSLDQIKKRFLKNNLFFSASNADSQDGKEGEYFVYSYDEAFEALRENGFSEEEAEINLEYLDITFIGNFEDGLSNPHLNNNLEEDQRPEKLEQTLFILKDLRKIREYPFIDKKIITSWNAMMIKAFFKAGYFDEKYSTQAFNSLNTLIKNMYKNKKLYHYRLDGTTASQEALLEDYAFLIDTLLEAYNINYNKKYLKLAKELSLIAIDKFYKNNTWYLNNTIFKAKVNFIDRYYTSAISVLLDNLLTIANFEYDMSLLYETKKMIKNYKAQILSDVTNHPNGIKLLIRIKNKDIILKSKPKNLINSRDEIESIKYPFLYTKAENENIYLACDESSCFAYDKNLRKIIEKINQNIKK